MMNCIIYLGFTLNPNRFTLASTGKEARGVARRQGQAGGGARGRGGQGAGGGGGHGTAAAGGLGTTGTARGHGVDLPDMLSLVCILSHMYMYIYICIL